MSAVAQTFTFRSAVNGFHRGDVVKYIGDLMEENASLKKQVETLRVLGKTLTAESASQKAEIERLQAALQQAEARPRESGRKLDAARLGEAMYDVRRFSDLLISEANEKTGALFSKAADAAEGAEERLDTLSFRTAELENETAQAFADIKAKLDALSAELNAFRSGVTEDTAGFLQHFTDETAKKFEEFGEEA